MATEEQVDMIENIQYYCWDVAQKRRDAFRQGRTFKLFDYERQSVQIMDEDEPEEIEEPLELLQPARASDSAMEIVDERGIEEARLKHNQRDKLFANQANPSSSTGSQQYTASCHDYD